jgi:hypothetical protein
MLAVQILGNREEIGRVFNYITKGFLPTRVIAVGLVSVGQISGQDQGRS